MLLHHFFFWSLYCWLVTGDCRLDYLIRWLRSGPEPATKFSQRKKASNLQQMVTISCGRMVYATVHL